MEKIKVHSWNELQDELFADAYDPSLGRFRSPFVFRGAQNKKYQLRSALHRIGENYQEVEKHLLRNFRRYAHRDVVECDSVFHWMAVAQHHGLPTRLIDWTYSPLIAIHFATARIAKFDRDGCIYMINFLKAKQYLPEDLQAVLREEGGGVFTVSQLAAKINQLKDLKALYPEIFPIFMEPPSLDDRMANQYALFSFMSDISITLDDWLHQHPELVRKIIIPKEIKWELRDKLDQANITERMLFPGLDGLSMWLKRQYSTKNPKK
jgi:hypothetical protein